MAKERKSNGSGQSTNTSTIELPPGMTLVRTLRGHPKRIGRIAWSADGRLLASPSYDETIRLWDAETGACLHTLVGHNGEVNSVAFNPQGSTLASGGQDGTVRLWEADSGRLLRTLKGHKDWVWSVTFDPQGRTLASGSGDKSIKLWEADTGQLLRTLDGHEDCVNSVAFDPRGRTLVSSSDDYAVKLWETDSGRLLRTLVGHGSSVLSAVFDPQGRTLASGSWDRTVKLWEADSGRLLRTLEGHTGVVNWTAFLSDGRLVASKGEDDVRLWSNHTGACLAVIPEPTSHGFFDSLTFHPCRPWLATVGSAPGTPEENRDRVIHIWALNLAVLLAPGAAPTVSYTSAKIVLVGESNVGKSYLAHRIAKGRRPGKDTIQSTHGMRFWPMEPKRLSPKATVPEGQRRDVVLWDMGGQEEYRLIHQLFLHDTTVALVLLDPTRGRAAFKEVETWNNYLEKQLHGRPTVKLLVGAKMDQPSDTIDRQGLDRLGRECGFAGYHETSALTGRGVRELCAAVARAIDWDGLGKTSRPELFQRIRDEIEARRKRGDVVLHVADLHRALSDEPPTDEEERSVLAVTEQLAAQGVIARSHVSTGEPVLVLQVQEIERHAGSLIIAARNNPRGVPALDLNQA